MDDKHMHIVPPANTGSTYYNYKHFNSIVLMALVDSNYEFIYADVGKNGRLSDVGVLEYTKFHRQLKAIKLNLPHNNDTVNNLNYVFLGDEAFSCDVVENAYGIISSRFRIMHTSINMKPKNIYVILAICVIHVFLRRRCNEFISPTITGCENTDTYEVYQGGWKNNSVEFIGLQQVNTRNTTYQGKINRDNYKLFFNSEGKVQ